MQRRMQTRGLSGGLARYEPPPGTMIVYAAKAGSVSVDGDAEIGLFTAALLKYLVTPGLDIRLALGRIRDDVLRASKGRQEPFAYGSLGGDIVALAPAAWDARRVQDDFDIARQARTPAA